MHLIHIAIGTLCAVIGYVLGIYFPLMPMQFLIMGGITYHSIVAYYKRRRAAELQAILDAQPLDVQPLDVQPLDAQPITNPEVPEALDTPEINPDLVAAFERMVW